MCGFEADEVEKELPRIEKAFNRLGITAEDIERGKQRLTKYYDIELEGVRKLLRLHVKNVVNSLLAKEEGKKKIVYGFMAPEFNTFASALAFKSEEVQVTSLCPQFQLVLGSIFDKIVPVLEAAEKKWLKAGRVAHCANVKSLVGLFALDLLPKPDLLVTTGFLCETAPKTIDLLRELHGVPVSYYDTCEDIEFRESPKAIKRTVDFAVKSLRKFVEIIHEVVGIEITDDMLREVLEAKEGLHSALRKLDNLIASSDPLLISANHQILWEYSEDLSINRESLPVTVEAINTLCEELQERANKGEGVVEKGAPRVLALLPPHQTDPRLDHLFGELGMALIAYKDAGFTVPYEGETEDPYVDMSVHLQGPLATSLSGRIPLIIEGCRRLKIDGVLNRYHAGCRAVTSDALMIGKAVAEELGIPVLSLEWENFDPRVYNHEQYQWRFELFKTVLNNSREHRLG